MITNYRDPRISIRELQADRELAQKRIDRDQELIRHLDEVISERTMTAVKAAGIMVHTGCIADS